MPLERWPKHVDCVAVRELAFGPIEANHQEECSWASEALRGGGVAAAFGVLRFPEQGERGFQPKMNSPSEAT
jgi:hypothetical protein